MLEAPQQIDQGTDTGPAEAPSKTIVDWRTVGLTSAGALLGLLAAASQLVGWIDITVRTAIITILVAVVFVLFAPPYIARQHEKNFGTRAPRKMIRLLAAASAVLLTLAVLAPLTVRFGQARSAASDGRADYHAQRYAAALPNLQRAAETYRSIGLGSGAVPSEIRMYQTLAELGRRDEATALGAQLRELTLSDHQLGLVDATAANIASALGEFEQAATLYQQARQLVDEGSTDYATVLLNEASLILARGSIREPRALDNLDRAMEIYVAHGDELGRAYVLAADAETKATPAERRATLEQALVIAEDEGDLGLTADIRSGIASSLRQSDEPGLAAEHYDAALTAYEDLADPLGQAVIFSNLAVLEAQTGEHALARAHLNDAKALFSRLDLEGNAVPPRQLAHLYDLSGTVAELLGDRDLAMENYDAALAILERDPDPLLRVSVLFNYGGLAQTGGNFDDAESRYDEAQSLLQRLVDVEVSPMYAQLMLIRSGLASERGDLDSAADFSRRAVDVAEASGDQSVLNAACQHHVLLVTVLSLGDAQPQCDMPLNASSPAEDLLLEYNNTPGEALGIAEELLVMLDDPTMTPATELLILSSILPTDLQALDSIVPVDARLRELLPDSRLTSEERALVAGQLAKLAVLQGRPDAAVEFASEALVLTTSQPRPRQPSWRIVFGYIVATNGFPIDGVDAMWEGFHDGQLSIFQDLPDNEYFSVVQLETVLLDYRDQLEADVQRAHIEQAMANAILGDTLETLETLLSDFT